MTGTYKLHNFVTGHYYIGAALDVFDRYTQHLNGVAKGKKPKKWQRAWTKHPELLDLDTWECLVLQEFETLEEAMDLETVLLNKHVGKPLCLNTKRTTGRSHSQPVRQKNSEIKTGRNLSADHRNAIKAGQPNQEGARNPFYGKTHTDAHKANITGAGNPYYGKTHSPEVRAKMRATHAAKRYTKAFFQWLGDLT